MRKWGRPIVRAEDGERGVDVPCVYMHDGRYWLLFIAFDGQGYRNRLATSTDLYTWRRHPGEVLPWGPAGAWDHVNCSGTWILRDNALEGPPVPVRARGSYWMVYHAFPRLGYEAGPGAIGLARSADLLHWERAEQPALRPEDGAAWERGGLYKGCLVEHAGTYHLFYNAKDEADPWQESIGLATSSDLVHWTRSPANPLLRPCPEPAWRRRFVADPCVLRLSDGRWLMAFYAYDGTAARDGWAIADHLAGPWTAGADPWLDVGPPGAIDSRYAHKPYILCRGDTLFHLYCAVRADGTGAEERCLAMATQPLSEAPWAQRAAGG